MIIGVLEAGPVPPGMEKTYVRYGNVFETMIRPELPEATFSKYVVYEGELPASPNDADGWIISGSKFGAYEDHDWIPPLETLIRAAVARKIPMVGICFGHQIMAQALGGKVIKSEKGWGLGRHIYDISSATPWMKTSDGTFASHAVHQDQVIEAPQDATVIASSDFSEFAAFAYGNPEHPYAISVQPHPEFSPDFVTQLINIRRGSVFNEKIADDALATIGGPVNNADWATWIASFFASRTA